MEKKHIPIIIAVILIIIGIAFFNKNVGIMGNFILLGIIVGVIPYILISYFEYKLIKSIEEQLPNFMLDLSESQKTGMTLPTALKAVSKIDYGKLSLEVKKINDQISWGIPIQEVLRQFSERMKKSEMISRVVRIINEAYTSGGDITRTLESTASDIITIREAEKERKAMMFQHVMVMYAIYFIFIGIIVGLSKTLIPMLQATGEAGAGGGGLGAIFVFQSPCIACEGSTHIFCISCRIFSVVCKMFRLGEAASCYYRALFLLMIIVQGIFAGLVVGQIGESSIIAGFKHSIIMTVSGFAIIMILLQVGMV